MMPASPYDWLVVVAASPFVGSFLSVLITRLPRHEDIVLRASHCPDCKHNLAARDLVPVASFVVSNGACRYCGTAISNLYPAVEVAAVVIALWSATLMSGWLLWVTCLLGWALLALAVMDLREMVLSDRLTLPLVAAGLLVTAVIAPAQVPHHIVGALTGFVIIAAVAYVYARISGREGLGLGDAKLLAAAGAWLSWGALGGVLMIGALCTLAAVACARCLGQAQTRNTAVPLGPGLALGIWLCWLYGPLVLT